MQCTHHMLLPSLLGPSGFQLLQVPQLAVQLVHPVGLGLVGHVVLLQQLAGSFTGSESLDNLKELKGFIATEVMRNNLNFYKVWTLIAGEEKLWQYIL